MVIEGMLALTGQHFIIEYNERQGTLPGFVEGFGLVARDEHRHVAFGARFLREMAARDDRYREAIQRTLVECGPAADGVLQPPWMEDAGDDVQIFGYTVEETRAFATKALERRLKVIGLTPSEDAAAERHFAARLQQDDPALLVGHSDDQDLRDDRADLARREVHDADHHAALELLARVVGDLRRRALLADLVTEVHAQLPCRSPRLGKVRDLDDAPDAHVDPVELFDRRHGGCGPAVATCPAGAAGPGLAARAHPRAAPAA
jgi:hypothetical protein